MKKVLNQGGAGYRTPACTLVELSQEGMLCVSFTNESFTVGEDNAATYGKDVDENNGWF